LCNAEMRVVVAANLLAAAAAYYPGLCTQQEWLAPSGDPDDPMCCWHSLDFDGETLSDGSVGTGPVLGYGVYMYNAEPDDEFDILSQGIVRDRCVVSFNPFPTRWTPCHSDATEGTGGCYLSDGAGGVLVQIITTASTVLATETGAPSQCDQQYDWYPGQRNTPAVDVNACVAGCAAVFELTSTQGYAQPPSCADLDDVPLGLYAELVATFPTVIYEVLRVIFIPILALVGL